MYVFKSQSFMPKYIQYIATMTGGSNITGNSALAKSLRAQNVETNSRNIQAGVSINAARTSQVASAAQALANQTGGNILGFTYE
jgi:hypothetical protein